MQVRARHGDLVHSPELVLVDKEPRSTTGQAPHDRTRSAVPGTSKNPAKDGSMTRSAALVLVLLVLGNMVAEHFSLPVPGAALGLAALSILFLIRRGPDQGMGQLFDFAAPYFPLFFVPAAVGVVASIDVIEVAWVSILAAIVFSTVASLLITGLVFQAVTRRFSSEDRS